MGRPLETSIFKFRLDQKSQRSLHFFLAAECFLRDSSISYKVSDTYPDSPIGYCSLTSP